MSRLAVVTDSGETLSEELTFPLAASHLLSKHPPKQTVITNTCTTRTLDSVASSHDAKVIKTKVGQAYIIDAMREHHAILGGDGSGSVAVAGHVNGYDGFAAMALIAEAIAVNNIPLSGLAGQLPRFNLVKKTIPCHAANAYSLLRNLRQHCRGAKVSDDDGIRFDWKDGWIHLRNSATEPLIRMIVEWNSPAEAEDRALEMRGIIDRMVYHE
jgi:phosphomannomutase